jgi:hypothetical protein
MAELATERELAIAYARAAKTPGVLDSSKQSDLSTLYLEAARNTNQFANLFVLEVQNTSLNHTIEPSRVDASASAAAESLRTFVNTANTAIRDQNENIARPADITSTMLAISVAITAAQELGAKLQAWWTAEEQRQRAPFIRYGESLKMPIWPDITALEVDKPQQ